MAFRADRLAPEATTLKAVFGAVDPALLPAIGSAADPTLAGGRFELYNPRTGEVTAISLPAAAWQVRSLRAASHTSTETAPRCMARAEPIAVDARGVRIRCGRASLGFTLDEFTQGRLAASVILGTTTSGRRFCSVFGETVRKDFSPRFVAGRAAAPERCWLPRSFY